MYDTLLLGLTLCSDRNLIVYIGPTQDSNPDGRIQSRKRCNHYTTLHSVV